MKSRALVIVLLLFLLKEHPLAGANSIKDLPQDLLTSSSEPDNHHQNDYFVNLNGEASYMEHTVRDLRSLLAIKTELLIVKDELIKTQREHLNNKNEQISDLRSHIKSLETSISERSNQLSQCRETEANLPDSCPSAISNRIYELKLRGMEPFKAPCRFYASDMMVIQRRVDGSVNFDRNWSDYKNGFGNVSGEFFLGLEKVHRMTASRPHELHIKLGKVDGSTSYAHYDDFQIGSEDELYELKKLGTFSGEAGDSLKYHLNQKFTTFDRDNDEYEENCATNGGGGWWYYDCGQSSLNGKYHIDGHNRWSSEDGINWGTWHGYNYTISLTFVEMMIWPKT
ncbi:fibrinogen-like protein 1 [Drosophila takahashii]|uniref:fibrinogen-like protein 1 n=1 Tax=Drosophila takahashii TaxID=29030 RepID=UPI001CF84278|nr:fibrinogen-like protein 1 [Drosophila takahashii]